MNKNFEQEYRVGITINNFNLSKFEKESVEQLKASSGVLTIGAPLRLNDVFTITGHPVFFLNSDINL